MDVSVLKSSLSAKSRQNLQEKTKTCALVPVKVSRFAYFSGVYTDAQICKNSSSKGSFNHLDRSLWIRLLDCCLEVCAFLLAWGWLSKSLPVLMMSFQQAEVPPRFADRC